MTHVHTHALRCSDQIRFLEQMSRKFCRDSVRNSESKAPISTPFQGLDRENSSSSSLELSSMNAET